MENKKTSTVHIVYIILSILGVMLLKDVIASRVAVETIPYSRFQELLKAHKVTEVVVSQDEIRGAYRDDDAGISNPDKKDENAAESVKNESKESEAREHQTKRFVTTRVEPDLAKTLAEYDVKFSQTKESMFLPMLFSWIMPILLFGGLWFFVIRRVTAKGAGGGGLMAIGKSKARVYMETDTKTTFADVAGVDEAKEELEEIVSFLRDPKHHGRLGARMPRGVLLVGPPGTGKTLLARAVAGEASVPFFSISGSEFVEMFVGVGAARVRDLFEQARQKAPAIIFIDELDALGRARNASPFAGGGHDEKEQTLNQLLVELDGFDASSGVVLLAATNRPEILDPALLRAGRFDRQVLVDRPDRIGRIQILRVHTKKVSVDPNLEVEKVAALTPGFSGADLANLVNEAALAATRRGAATVALEDFSAGVERIVAGLERKNRILSPEEREIVAYHEMGHALVAGMTPGADTVHKISIIPRGVGALGYTIQRPSDDRHLLTRDQLEGRMAVLLGGRAAESIVFGHLSTGAADDLEKATDIARNMATRFGMIPSIGHVVFDTNDHRFLGDFAARPRPYSDKTAEQIDEAIRNLVESAFERATLLLTQHRDVLQHGARSLLEKETLQEDDIAALIAATASTRTDTTTERGNGRAPESPTDGSEDRRTRPRPG